MHDVYMYATCRRYTLYALTSALAFGFLVVPLTAFLTSFLALVTFPATVFLIFGLVSFLAAGAFFGLATAGFLVVVAFFFVGTGAGAALSKMRGLEDPVLERVLRSVGGMVTAIIIESIND